MVYLNKDNVSAFLQHCHDDDDDDDDDDDNVAERLYGFYGSSATQTISQ